MEAVGLQEDKHLSGSAEHMIVEHLNFLRCDQTKLTSSRGGLISFELLFKILTNSISVDVI
jgi:hypothetical protein